MKLTLTASALVIALTASSAFAADMRRDAPQGRDSNRAWYQGNSQTIYNATQATNLSGDTARGGGTVGMSSTGHSYIDHGKTYTGEQTSAMVVKH